jgi:hypothetical protein
VILAFGIRPERIVGEEGRIDAVPEPPKQEQSELLVEAVSSGVAAGGHVIAIVPTWFAPEALLRLEMARSLLDTDRLIVHETAMPPLAATVLASLASAAGRYAPSVGLLASLLPEFEAELHVFTWLGSVSKLSTPAPSLGQHVASLTPGTAFGVSSWPEPSVHRITTGDPSVPLPEIVRPSRLVVAPRSDPHWITHTVNGALGGLPVLELEATPGGPAWWGTGKLVESVVCPADVRSLVVELLDTLEPWPCRWCDQLVARSPCPVCGHRGRPLRRRGAAPAREQRQSQA